MSHHMHSGFEIPLGSKYRPPRTSKLGYNIQNMIGKTSGHLTVQSVTDYPARLHCVCACGGTRIVEVYVWNRTTGGATSCGPKCPVAHPKAVTKSKQGTFLRKSAAEWAQSIKAQMSTQKCVGWGVIGVVAEGSGFRVVTGRPHSGKGRPPVRRVADDVVGYYTPDIPLEHLAEDLQVFLDDRDTRAATRSWERSVR